MTALCSRRQLPQPEKTIMKRILMLSTTVALLGAVAIAITPKLLSAEKTCWYEGTSYDRCNGQSCPGGWCCRICVG